MGHQDNAGKFIAFILRHHPEAIGMKLDERKGQTTRLSLNPFLVHT